MALKIGTDNSIFQTAVVKGMIVGGTWGNLKIFFKFQRVLEKMYVVGQSFGFMNILAQGKDTKGANLKTILKGIIVQMESREQGTGTVEAPLGLIWASLALAIWPASP